jgi:hypothetical protein
MRHEERDETPGSPEWARKLFEMDRQAIDECDAVLTLYYGNYSDTGTAWECGYAPSYVNCIPGPNTIISTRISATAIMNKT